MTETQQPPAQDYPEATVVRRRRVNLSLAWLVPIAALVVGAVLIVRTVMQAGPTITVTFRTAEGIEAAHTEVRFKEVVVGKVTKVALSPNRAQVLVTVKLDKSAERLAVADTRFWAVRPRVGLAGVSGLGTLFSGAYIGVDAGVSNEEQLLFTGLEAPPPQLRDEPGRSFVLKARDLGSLDVGSPVYYRRTKVGRVVGYTLDPERDTLAVQVVVTAPNDRLVTSQSRFWNASGVDLNVNASGLTLDTQSLASVVLGGVAFANPADAASAPPAADGQRFDLFTSRKAALAPPDGPALRVRMVFDQAQRGLAPGAPVDMLGIEIGSVRSVALIDAPKGDQFPVEVIADLHPLRLGSVRRQFVVPPGGADRADALFLKRAVDHGLRAQVRTGNLLTGQLYVALDFIPKAPTATLDARADPPTIPTVRGALSDLQPQLADIVARLSKVKFDEIGSDLQVTLRNASAASDGLQETLASATEAIRRLTPEAQGALAEVQKTLASTQATLANLDRNVTHGDAPLQRNLTQALAEMQRAAQALRVLSDYLQLHPESLLRGKPADADPSKPAEGGR
ncbi:MAG: MlaD family protein [Pseudomonadota bacterium]